MKIPYIFILTFVVNLNIYSQNNDTYQTIRTDIAPEINGLFDDKAWERIEWTGEFTQFEPNEGSTPFQQTLFKILYDDNNIYVAIKSLDTEPDKIEKRLSRRDEWEGDLSGIHFDSYFDKRTSFVFAVSAAGVKNDGFFSNDGDGFDDSWDPIWYVKTKVTSEGWNAEMRIPLSQLRFNNNPEQIWGLEVVRSIFRHDELSLWKPISTKKSGWVSQYGQLKGIENIKPKRNIEIIPFIVTKLDKYNKVTNNPFADGSDFNFEGGIDGKIGITNNLTLDFAINPDFGQVEADPSEVNLTAYESYFSEKRPFFIEGNNITNFQLTPGDSPWSRDNLFYSRRIGKKPILYPHLNSGEYVKLPNTTRILGSFKLTGKTKKGWSIGIIESITNKENALIDDNINKRKEVIEPLTNYFITRIQKDINDGNTIIGGMITSTYRNINNKDLEVLPTHAFSGGLDFTQYFKKKKYFIKAQIVASNITGSARSIENLQLSSRRYYQRPDSEYLSYDPNKTSLFGTGGTFMTGKNSSSGFKYLFNFTWRSPGLELNDVGYLREANNIFQFLWLSYKINKPFSIFRSIQVNTNEWSGWDYDGNTLFKGGNLNFNMQFKNLWRLGIGINGEGNNRSNSELRGGPALITPGGRSLWSNLNTSPKKKIKGSIGASINMSNQNYKNSISLWSGITYRPINTLSLSISPRYTKNNTELQYVQKKDNKGEPIYIFANLSQNTFNLTMKFDYNITPNLSIQYYGSPFVSSVLYDDFKKITNPTSNTYNDRFQTFNNNEIVFNQLTNLYSIDESGDGITDYNLFNPNFNFKQFRSNMVLRWEYIPGSTLFLVWSQGRTDYEPCDCEFNLKDNFKDLFKASPRDILLLKLSYRIDASR